MHPVWRVPGCVSGKNTTAAAADEPPDPPLVPPDLPNPSSPLSSQHFPTLSEAKTTPKSTTKYRFGTIPRSVTAPSSDVKEAQPSPTGASKVRTAVPPSTEATNKTLPLTMGSALPTDSFTVSTDEQNHGLALKIIPPKDSSPLQTNKSLSSVPPKLNPIPFIQKQTNQDPTKILPAAAPEFPSGQTASLPTQPPPPTLVERIRLSEDKTLKRLAPVTYAPSGRPRVLIHDSVFKKGAELHKDFIICYFNGRAPPFNQIQSVFNHMWGKGKRLEIHNNPLNHSAIVRIQSEYLRHKILEKNIWYVGDSMFHTARWSSVHSKTTPQLKAIKIWAHLTGVPLDLRHDEGLSLVAGLVGEPKETDDFTKNLVSLTLSHVKVEVDLTQSLPSVVELEREDGEVVEVSVHYPWVPPTCSHCHELGHIVKNCLLYSPPQEDSDAPQPKANSTSVVEPSLSASTEKVTHAEVTPSLPSHPLTNPPTVSHPTINPSLTPLKSNQQPLSNPLLNLLNATTLNPFLTPQQNPRPSLKRSRSSPTLSPPLTSNPNPFVQSTTLSNTSQPSPSDQNPPPSSLPFVQTNINPFTSISSSSSTLKLSNSFVASGFSNLAEDPPHLF